jgi:hypothetical protein
MNLAVNNSTITSSESSMHALKKEHKPWRGMRQTLKTSLFEADSEDKSV